MSSNVFSETTEIHRLEIQNRLLQKSEDEICKMVLSEFEYANILDIGCNDGKKLITRFSNRNINKVIGIDNNENLIKSAEQKYGDDKFSFKYCDVETDCFEETIEMILRENNINGFHIIGISYVLLHLKNAEKLLKQLNRFLLSNGKLIIVEPLDSETYVGEKNKTKLQEFIEILNRDPLAGNRKLIEKIDQLFMQQGYKTEKTFPIIIRSEETKIEKKKEIFDIFFSYLPDDIKILRMKYPNNEYYINCENWLSNNYNSFKHDAIFGDEEIKTGICIKIASKIQPGPDIINFENESEFYLEKLNKSTIVTAKELCDFCVGKDLYSIDDFNAAIDSTNQFYYILRNRGGDAAGYIYFSLTDLDFISKHTKIDRLFYEKAFKKSNPVIGDLRSGGVLPQYRNHNLANKMYEQAIKYLTLNSSEIIVGICWKYQNKVPIKKILESFGLKYLTEAHRIWYNHTNLFCPVCSGRCNCNAEILYKILEEEK